MAVNRYHAACAACGHPVPANGGTLTKAGKRWEVRHPACAAGPNVVGAYFPATGLTLTVNARGRRCMDAPCCGCCS